MEITVTTQLNLGVFEKLVPLLKKQVKRSLKVTAQKIQRDARNLAPKDTTGLSRSIYILLNDFNDYEERVSDAVAANPKMEVLPLGEIPTSPEIAIIAVAASYAMFLEYGTATMPAQPFMTPAILGNKGIMSKDLRIGLHDAISEAVASARAA